MEFPKINRACNSSGLTVGCAVLASPNTAARYINVGKPWCMTLFRHVRPSGLVFIVVVALSVRLEAATFYIAPNGNDTNAGTFGAPFFTVSKAASVAAAGDFIFLRGGTFNYTNTIRLTNSGGAGAPIRLWVYTNELPFLDFSSMADDGNNRGFLVTSNANWWHFKGLEIYRAGDNGMKVEGSYNVIEQCSFHHNRDSGLQIGLGDSDEDISTRVCSNLVLNCDSYLNYDPRASGGNADGFCCKLHPGAGNRFIGCRSWENSDDGWDLYKNEFDVTLEDCWCWHNGDPASFGVGSAGNAEGFKLGGDSNFSGPRYLRRCIAFNNRYGSSSDGKAYHQNDHRGNITLYNCLSFSNNYNYALNNDVEANEYVANCVGFNGVTKNFSFNSTTIQTSNSWNFGTNIVNANASDYSGLTESLAKAPRQADGSLPAGFAHLVVSTDLIDRGADVGLPFTGARPDLGPFEFSVAPAAITLSAAQFTNGGFRFQINGLTSHGPVVIHGSSNFTSWTPLFTNPAVTGSFPYFDAAASNAAVRLYRAEER